MTTQLSSLSSLHARLFADQIDNHLGHYSFECKAAASERPYVSRPSRTQQLLNPSLRPALTESTPPSDAVILKKKGTADEILKSKQKERERDRALDRSDRGRKRRRERLVTP